MQSSWEAYATQLANAGGNEGLAAAYEKLVIDLKIKPETPANIVFARDTRPSGITLVKALKDGLNAIGAKYQDFGVFTTPQLHYVVRCINTRDTTYAYGDPTEEGYRKKLSSAFKLAMKYKKSTGSVTVDCANGVGGPKLRDIIKSIPGAADGGLNFKVVNDNDADPEVLNSNVRLAKFAN